MQEKDQELSLTSLNYNDRADGWGFGEAECLDDSKDYQSDPHFTQHNYDLGEGYRCHRNQPYSRDELGLRNQYGPVDQYSFRDISLFILKGHRPPPEEIID